MRLGKWAECMSGCKTLSVNCKWNMTFPCPSTTQFQCPPFWHWKWNVPLCRCKSGLEMLCFYSATNQSFLDFFTYKNGWKTGRLGTSSPCSSPPSLHPSQEGSCYARPYDSSTQQGAQHGEPAWEPVTRHSLVQLHRRGQICPLTNCAIVSVTRSCLQNFHGWAYPLQCNVKLQERFFWLWKPQFNHVYFPVLLHLKRHVQEVFILK